MYLCIYPLSEKSRLHEAKQFHELLGAETKERINFRIDRHNEVERLMKGFAATQAQLYAELMDSLQRLCPSGKIGLMTARKIRARGRIWTAPRLATGPLRGSRPVLQLVRGRSARSLFWRRVVDPSASRLRGLDDVTTISSMTVSNVAALAPSVPPGVLGSEGGTRTMTRCGHHLYGTGRAPLRPLQRSPSSRPMHAGSGEASPPGLR